MRVAWNEVWDIVEDTDKKGQTIYRPQYKLSGEILMDYMSTDRLTVQTWCYKWTRDNQRKAQDIIFENMVLNGK